MAMEVEQLREFFGSLWMSVRYEEHILPILII